MRIRALLGGVVIAVIVGGSMVLALPYPSTCDQCLNYAPWWACIGVCGW